MTVLPLQWLLARPRRRGVAARSRRPAIVTRVTRRLGPARRPVPPGRRAYPDVFFADPVAVEDDSRRMRPGPHPADWVDVPLGRLEQYQWHIDPIPVHGA